MDIKKESPNNQAGRTGGNNTVKVRKRKRISKPELVSKWHTPAEVLTWERGAV